MRLLRTNAAVAATMIATVAPGAMYVVVGIWLDGCGACVGWEPDGDGETTDAKAAAETPNKVSADEPQYELEPSTSQQD